jgi:hypothetical protein
MMYVQICLLEAAAPKAATAAGTLPSPPSEQDDLRCPCRLSTSSGCVVVHFCRAHRTAGHMPVQYYLKHFQRSIHTMVMTGALHGWWECFYRNALRNIRLDRGWHVPSSMV